MPQRTNPFQELVALIQRAFAAPGDSVTPSAMVKVHGLDTEREIDILHETTAGTVRIKVAFEAKDEKRPIDLITFESYAGKYRGEGRVDVHQFVVVSRHGFTEGAVEKARLMGVPLVTLAEAEAFDWKALLHHAPFAAPQTFTFNHAPHICRVRFTPAAGEDLTGADLAAARLVHPSGRDCGTVKAFAEAMLRRVDPSWIGRLVEKARAEGNAVLTVSGAIPGSTLHLREQTHGVEWIAVQVHARSEAAGLVCKTYEWQQDGRTTIVQHLTATFGDQVFDLAMPDGLNARRVALRIGPKAPAQKKAPATPKAKAERRRAAARKKKPSRKKKPA